MNLTKDILREFKSITNKDVETYLSRCAVFFNNYYTKIVSYYSGDISTIEKGAFEEFDNLERSCEDLFSTYQEMQNRLNNLKWWILLELLEAIDVRFKSLRKINKWSKSSLKNVGYDSALQATYTLKPKQTLERVSQDILNKNNPQDEWLDIALSNELKEEDYTVAGGVPLQLSFPQINRGIQITSVVDVMLGKSIYGKDVYKKIQFNETEEDLEVLDYDDTIHQAVEILAALKQNDNPEFPGDGIQRQVIIGGNRAALNFPIINRQMSQTFATDDSLKNFQLTNIEVDQDNLSIGFEVQTRLNETQEGVIVV